MACTAEKVDQVPLEDFVPYVAMYCKGAPDDLIAHNVRLSAIEFCSRTLALERGIFIDAQAEVHDYCIQPDDDCVTVRSIVSVCFEGVEYSPLRSAPCVSCCKTPANGCGACGRSRSYWVDENRELLIWPAPHCDSDQGIEVRVKYIPGQDCCYLPRFLYNTFAEVIADGATYRLLMMRGAPWYDTGMATAFVKKHASGVGMAKTLAARRFNSAPVKLATRRWA